MTRRVLVVAYAFPPAGGPGVQRVLKLVKYLPELGFEPLVLTVRDGTFPALDPSLLGEVPGGVPVERTASLEPASLYKRFVGIPAAEPIPVAVLAEPSPSARQRLAHFVRLNLFVPDAKVGWLPFAVTRGSELIRRHRPDVIFSSAPPPTNHLVACCLAAAHRLPWVADFRDPWTDVHYYEGHHRLAPARALDAALERAVFRRADRLVFVSGADSEKAAASHGTGGKHHTVPNGFDEEDFEAVEASEPPGGRFELMHLGSIGAERTPSGLLAVLRRLQARGEVSPATFRLTLVGKVEPSVGRAIDEAGVAAVVERVPYVPHDQAVRLGQRASALLLLVTRSRGSDRILPGKTFEYLRHQRPVLALGPPGGEVARVLEQTGGGRLFAYDDETGIERELSRLLSAHREGRRLPAAPPAAVARYTRRHIAGELAGILTAAVGGRA